MADRWIVSGYKFVEHETWDVAAAEADRLRKKTGKPFRIYRIKTTVKSDGGAAALAAENELLRSRLHAVSEGKMAKEGSA